MAGPKTCVSSGETQGKEVDYPYSDVQEAVQEDVEDGHSSDLSMPVYLDPALKDVEN